MPIESRPLATRLLTDDYYEAAGVWTLTLQVPVLNVLISPTLTKLCLNLVRPSVYPAGVGAVSPLSSVHSCLGHRAFSLGKTITVTSNFGSSLLAFRQSASFQGLITSNPTETQPYLVLLIYQV